MKINHKILLFYSAAVLLAASNIADGQWSRTIGMGGLSYSINDRDAHLDPYLFGGNPAWITESRLNQYLEITPSYAGASGDYRRIYTPENLINYNAGFIGVKPLGASGTFLGRAEYDYQIRRNNYRNLKKDAYGGEAFFFTDTTQGNVIFNGPTIEFSHGFELFDNFFLGASAEYQILNGLKEIYTYAQTVYRNVRGKIGAAYRITNSLSIAADYQFSDSQERIEASDVNLLTVRTFHFRGEKYSIELRGSSVNYKIKKNGSRFGGQIYYSPNKKLEAGISAAYSLSSAKTLIPRNSIIDDEDGKADFDNLIIDFAAKYSLAERTTAGISAGYRSENSWTKNSKRDLLLWQWNTTGYRAGAGISYYLLPDKMLIGGEYEFHYDAADSSKYIDNRFNSIDSPTHIFRFGAEYGFSPEFIVRAGINYYSADYDLITGGNNVHGFLLTGGVTLYTFDSFILEGFASYDFKEPSAQRKTFSDFYTGITLRFFTF